MAARRWIIAAIVFLIFLIFLAWRYKLPQQLIAKFEGFMPKAYRDAGKFSIGYGHQIRETEQHLMTATLTKPQALDLLSKDIAERYAPEVDRIISGLGFTSAQRAALVSFHYNTGAIGKIAATLKTKDKAAIAAKLKLYNKSEGRVHAGLVKRREEEARAFT